MARPSGQGFAPAELHDLVVKRLKANKNRLNLDVVAQFCDKAPVTVNGWLKGNLPSTITSIKLWHLMEVAGIDSPELEQIQRAQPIGAVVGALLAFQVITADEACHIGGDVKIEAVYRAVRGESEGFMSPNYNMAQLNELYGTKLTEARNKLLHDLENGVEKVPTGRSARQPEEPRRERTRTRGGQPVEPVRLPPGVVPMTFGSVKSIAATTASRKGIKPVAPTDTVPETEPAPVVMAEKAPELGKESGIEGTDVIEQEQPVAEPVPATDAPTDPAASWTSGQSTASPEVPAEINQTEEPSVDANTLPDSDLAEVELALDPTETETETPTAVSLDIDAIADALMEHLGLTKQQLTAFLVSQQSDNTLTVPVDRLLDADRREKVYVLAQNLKKFEVDLAYILSTFSDDEHALLKELIGDKAFYNIKILATRLTGWRAQQVMDEGQDNA